MLVATYRSDELHRRHPLRAFLTAHAGGVERIELARFDDDELVRLLTAIRGEAPAPELAARLLARSEGNAFLAEELLAAGGTELPDTLREAMMVRVERVSDGAQGGAARRRVRRSERAPPPALRDGGAAGARAGGRAARGRDPPRAGAQRRRRVRVPPRAAARSRVRGRPAGRARPLARRDRPGARPTRRTWPARAARSRPRSSPTTGRRRTSSTRRSRRRSTPAASAARIAAFPEAQRHFEYALDVWDRVERRRGPRRDGSDRPDAPRRRRGAPRRRSRARDRAGA